MKYNRPNAMNSRFAFAATAAVAFALTTPLPAGAATSTWSTETPLAQPAQGSVYVKSAVNAGGVAAAVWDQRLTTSTSDVFVSVYAPGANGGWSPAKQLTATPTLYSANAGVVVAPSGDVTVFWSESDLPYYTVYHNGAWSPATVIPADSGYGMIAGAGADKDGNVQFAMAARRPNGVYSAYDVEFVVKDPLGNWRAPIPLTSTPGAYPAFMMNSNGQGLLVAGYQAFRSASTGVWNRVPQAIPSLAGQTYATDVAMDAAGNGYFVLYNRYGGANVTTSTPTSAWTKLRRVTKFEVMGSSIYVTASSAGHAMIYGVDFTTGKLRASVTTTTGSTWGALTNIGLISGSAQAAGSETGLYAIAWDGKVTAGTGGGAGTGAWLTRSVSANPYFG
ncbi:MAG: hypothetical protein NTU56_11935, partial [Proteobacteria bacterium]|nr:hypothetical protein [Pseudomonadota bacterium]